MTRGSAVSAKELLIYWASGIMLVYVAALLIGLALVNSGLNTRLTLPWNAHPGSLLAAWLLAAWHAAGFVQGAWRRQVLLSVMTVGWQLAGLTVFVASPMIVYWDIGRSCDDVWFNPFSPAVLLCASYRTYLLLLAILPASAVLGGLNGARFAADGKPVHFVWSGLSLALWFTVLLSWAALFDLLPHDLRWWIVRGGC